MKNLNREEMILFQTIFKKSQKDLKAYLTYKLRDYYGKKNIISKGKYIFVKGNIPITLVSHMDTVFDTPPKDIYYDKDHNIVWSPQGLGADDRAGIFSILQILKRGYLPNLVLTEDEEIGCVGARNAVKNIPNNPLDNKFIIELDRRGQNDCVFYDCDNMKFENYIQSFGFLLDFGTYSDISILCPQWGVAGVNVSIGYDSEHTKMETLNISWMYQTIERVCAILDAEKEAEYYEFIPSTKNYFEVHGCKHCKGYFYDFEMIPIKIKGAVTWFCPDCFAELFATCEKCGTVITRKNGGKLCAKCKGAI